MLLKECERSLKGQSDTGEGRRRVLNDRQKAEPSVKEDDVRQINGR